MTLTAMITTGAVVALGIYDLVVIVVYRGEQRSISRFLQKTALKHPLISFTAGFICGHIFGYMQP